MRIKSIFSYIVLVMAVVFTTAFFSCNTISKATKKQNKIAAKHPKILLNKCNEVYPTKIVKGDTITVIDSTDYKTIASQNKGLNDSIDKLLNQLPKIVTVGCEQYQNTIDALKVKLAVAPGVIYRTKTITDTVIDTKRIALINNQLIELQKVNQSLENANAIYKANEIVFAKEIKQAEKSLQKTKLQFYGSWLIFAALVILFLYLRNKLKGTTKFINGLNL